MIAEMPLLSEGLVPLTRIVSTQGFHEIRVAYPRDTRSMVPMDNSAASVGMPAVDGEPAGCAAIVERIRSCVERISREFDRWNDPHAQGPGLYFVVGTDAVATFTEPMGTNRWPVEDCASVFASPDALFEAAGAVAFACDGAVVVHDDATIEAAMVRVMQLSADEREQFGELAYAGWMGARHMSALETSTRPEVLAVVTLSEEDGRLTIFADGAFEDYPRDTVGDWRQGSE